MKKYITTFIVIAMGISIIFLFIQNQKNKEMLDKMKPIQTYIDSIVSENYMMNIEVGRYEYILDRADQEMSSECKDKLDSIFGETE
jgi:thiaminase